MNFKLGSDICCFAFRVTEITLVKSGWDIQSRQKNLSHVSAKAQKLARNITFELNEKTD